MRQEDKTAEFLQIDGLSAHIVHEDEHPRAVRTCEIFDELWVPGLI